jgi:predicted esterase
MQSINLKGVSGPHAHTEVLVRGNSENPKRALLLFHGRGASAANISRLADRIVLPDDVLVLAPDAVGQQWYPNRFVISRLQNEPHLSSALSVVGALIQYCDEEFGILPKDIVLAGFSQGACLASDYIARNPQKYAGVCIFSGGLIGTDEDIQGYTWKGDLKKTPVYLGCDESDPYIPKERVDITASILEKLGGSVTEKIYQNLGHAIHPEGVDYLHQLL